MLSQASRSCPPCPLTERAHTRTRAPPPSCAVVVRSSRRTLAPTLSAFSRPSTAVPPRHVRIRRDVRDRLRLRWRRSSARSFLGALRRRPAGTSAANKTSVAAEIVGAILRFPPLWEAASKGAKEKMVKRAGALGIAWDDEIAALRDAGDWDAMLRDATDPAVDANTPAYYKTSFHAYPEGNLGWDPALEVEVAAKAVHAPVFSEDGATLDPAGDENLRASYHAAQAEAMDAIDPSLRPSVRHVVDVGCSSGLSTGARSSARSPPPRRSSAWTCLRISSPSRGGHAARSGDPRYAADRVRFEHAAGEKLPFEDGTQDVVSSCLMFHELPASAAADVIAEAHRVLRPGGAFTMMDMDPKAPAFERIANNVFAFTAFKSTEPYLEQYAALDVQEVARRAGFETVVTRSNSPRHRTIVARKADASR